MCSAWFAHDVLHVMSALCAPHDLHTTCCMWSALYVLHMICTRRAACDECFMCSTWFAHNMLHVISTLCAPHDLHTVVLGHLSIHVGDSLWCSEEIKKSWIAPFNVMMMMMMMMMMMIMMMMMMMIIVTLWGKREQYGLGKQRTEKVGGRWQWATSSSSCSWSSQPQMEQTKHSYVFTAFMLDATWLRVWAVNVVCLVCAHDDYVLGLGMMITTMTMMIATVILITDKWWWW